MKERKRSGTEEIMFARWSLACLLAPWSLSTRTSTPRASVADPEGVYSRPRNYKTVDGVDVLDEKRRAHLT